MDEPAPVGDDVEEGDDPLWMADGAGPCEAEPDADCDALLAPGTDPDGEGAAGAVTGGVLGTVAGGTVIPGTVTPGTVTGGTVTCGTVTPGTVTPGTVTGGTVTCGTVTPGTVTPGTVTPGTVTPGTVTPGTETAGTCAGELVGTFTEPDGIVSALLACGCTQKIARNASPRAATPTIQRAARVGPPDVPGIWRLVIGLCLIAWSPPNLNDLNPPAQS